MTLGRTARFALASVSLVAAFGNRDARAAAPEGARVERVPIAKAAARDPVAVAPGRVLERYAAALARLPQPKNVSFAYAVEQLGAHDLVQTHLVYRSGKRERDETLTVDGYTLKRRSIRVLANRVDRYDVRAFAPKPSSYAFRFVRSVVTGGARGYVFRTAPLGIAPFSIDEITIDGASFLPTRMLFRVSGKGARGRGEIRYARSDRYWLVREAVVNVALANGKTARERIAWSNYQFPIALPPSTFSSPRALAPLVVETPSAQGESNESASDPANAPP